MINAKILISTLAITILFISCKSEQATSIIDAKILEFVKKDFHSPDDYEPISTTIIDTIYLMEKIEQLIDEKNKIKTSYKEKVEWNKKKIKRIDSDSTFFYIYRNNILKNQNKIKKCESELSEIEMRRDSILAAETPPVEAFIIIHKCRGKIPNGGLMLKKLKLRTDGNFNIIHCEEDNGNVNALF